MVGGEEQGGAEPAAAQRLARRIGELQGLVATQRHELEWARERGQILDDRLRHAQRMLAIRAAAEEAARRELTRFEDGEDQTLLRGLRQAHEQQRERAERLSKQVSDLSAELALLERRAAAQQRRRAQLEQEVATLLSHLRGVREDVQRAEASRAWRWGHGLTTLVRRVTLRKIRTQGALALALRRLEQIDQLATSPEPPSAPPSTVELPPPEEVEEGRRQLAEEIRDLIGPPATRFDWPRVSIVVLNRNGEHHLRRLLEGLRQHTEYPSFELIVVDNDSQDGSRELLGGLEDERFPVKVEFNAVNASFAEANAQGVEIADGDLLLFLNNDVVPFEDGWLHELVLALEEPGIGCVGAILLHPEASWVPGDHQALVQHRAIRFRMDHGEVRPYNFCDGVPLFDGGGLGERLFAPAVTAACLLASRATFAELGGFDTRFRYGTEDVDLGLRAWESGMRAVGAGRAVLFHEESSTQRVEGREFMRANRQANRRAFLERWGAQIGRRYRVARLTGDRFWTDGAGPRIAITVTSAERAAGWGDWYTAHELGEALELLGWQVHYLERRGDRWYDLPADLDCVISLIDAFDLRRVPDGVITVAWIRNWTDRWLEREWFSRADVLLASSEASRNLIRAGTGREATLFPLATNPERFVPVAGEPKLDYVFVGNWWGKDRAIQQALRPRSGEKVAVYGKGWDQVAELAQHARGEVEYGEVPQIYGTARIVLDDTQGPTLPYEAVNARVFDALAAGALVISNCTGGVRDLFDEDFPTWEAPESLRAQLDSLLADERRRRELVQRYRSQVLDRHTYAHRASQLKEILTRVASAPSFVLKIGAPDWQQAQRWGDLQFARAMARALEARGHRCLIQVLAEWEEDGGLGYDVVVHLKGRSLYRPKAGQFNVLWSISHPDELTVEECEGYDLVCVASEPYAEELGSQTSVPVAVLEQATDPMLFFEDPDPELAHALVYVANSRGVMRTVPQALLGTHELAMWGSGWDGLIEKRYLRGEHLPPDQLRRVYSSAGIVLVDHWEDMRRHGYISNRIYDALACGARILTDDVAGLAARFGELVHVYRSEPELRALVDELLATNDDPAKCAARREVVDSATFAERAERLCQLVFSHPKAVALELGVDLAAAVQ